MAARTCARVSLRSSASSADAVQATTGRLAWWPSSANAGSIGSNRLLRLAPAGPQLHQRGVDDDAMQPRGELGVAVEGVDGAEGGQERVLDGVPGEILVVQEAAGDGQHAAAERAHDGGVRVLVTGPEAVDQVDHRRSRRNGRKRRSRRQ